MIDLDAEVGVSAVKMIDLDAEVGVSAVKTMAGLVFEVVEIDGDGMHTEIALIEQDTTVLFQAVVVGSEIRYLQTVVSVVHQVYCLVTFVFDVECPLMLYRSSVLSVGCGLCPNLELSIILC